MIVVCCCTQKTHIIAMEVMRRATILALSRAGHKPMALKRFTGYPRSTIYDVVACQKQGKDASRSPRVPGTLNKWTTRFLAGLKRSVEANPRLPMTTLAKKKGVSRTTIRRSLVTLGMTSYNLTRKHLLTVIMEAKRLKRCWKILSKLKRKHAGHVLVFCDEKQFTVDRSFNKQNDRYLEKDRANVPAVFCTRKPVSVTVFGVVTSEGKKMPLHFFGTKEKVNMKVYLELFKSKVIPWLEENVEGPYIFIQDSVPAHKAKKTLKFLADHMLTFWEPTTWPSNSPDLNVLDYYM